MDSLRKEEDKIKSVTRFLMYQQPGNKSSIFLMVICRPVLFLKYSGFSGCTY